MPTRMPLIDTRMVDKLRDFFNSLCTINTSLDTQSTSGHPTPIPKILVGHVDIPCRIAPTAGKEIKNPAGTYAIGSHTIVLDDYYPTITAKMTAVINEIAYDILAIEFDGEHETTRLPVQVVT